MTASRRKTSAEKIQILEARLIAEKARLAQSSRKQRTAELVALGLLLQKMFAENTSWGIANWIAGADRHLDSRSAQNAKNALAAIHAARRNK